MGQQFQITVKGRMQGTFKGDSGPNKDKITGLFFNYEVTSPVDLATGQPGMRQHKPVVIIKEWGAASPQLFFALVHNEILDSVLLEFVRTNAAGAEEVYYTITLTNASVSDFRQFIGAGTGVPGEPDTLAGATGGALEAISLTFQKVQMENIDGKTSASDNWNLSTSPDSSSSSDSSGSSSSSSSSSSDSSTSSSESSGSSESSSSS